MHSLHWRIFYILPLLVVVLPLSFLQAQETLDSLSDTSEEVTCDDEATVGDLIKSEDASAVYYFADDGERYAFPNENVYFSWYDDFDGVKEISTEDLASVSFGGMVDYQAGTSLVKMPSVDTVYSVESGGVLREISSEEDAIALYGEDWASQVDDLSEAFFPQYEVGEPIDVGEGELPQGYIIQDEEGDLCRVDSTGACLEIDDVISEDLGVLYKQYAEDYDAVTERLNEVSNKEISFEEFDASTLESIFTELFGTLDPVSIEESMRVSQETYAPCEFEAYSEYKDEGEYDDEDGGRTKDYWDDVYEEWTDEGEDELLETSYEEWTDDGYDDYYNEYYDYYDQIGEKPEYDFEDWNEEYDGTSDWSYDDGGFYYTDEGGEENYYDEAAGVDYIYDDSTGAYYDDGGNTYDYSEGSGYSEGNGYSDSGSSSSGDTSGGSSSDSSGGSGY